MISNTIVDCNNSEHSDSIGINVKFSHMGRHWIRDIGVTCKVVKEIGDIKPMWSCAKFDEDIPKTIPKVRQNITRKGDVS